MTMRLPERALGNPQNHYGFRFEARAAALFDRLGIVRVGEHRFTGSPYQGHGSQFRLPRNLYLGVGFEPLDGPSAAMNFGRRWLLDETVRRLSCPYSLIAREFGFEHPLVYELGFEDEVDTTINAMCSDLEESLESVIERLDLETLMAVERDDYGAESILQRYCRKNFETRVRAEELL